jgi:hypothetical protein
MKKFESYKNWINEKFEEDTDPIHDMGIGRYTIKFQDYVDPILKEHGGIEIVSMASRAMADKYFKKFKNKILPLIQGKYVTGRMWEIRGRWKHENFTIKVVKILSQGSIFKDPKKNGMLFFNVLASNGKKYCLYLQNKYEINTAQPRKLYEKFSEDEDPIESMGIGRRKLITNLFEKRGLI